MPANEDTGSPPELASLPTPATTRTSLRDRPVGPAHAPHAQWGAWPMAALPCVPSDKLMNGGPLPDARQTQPARRNVTANTDTCQSTQTIKEAVTSADGTDKIGAGSARVSRAGQERCMGKPGSLPEQSWRRVSLSGVLRARGPARSGPGLCPTVRPRAGRSPSLSLTLLTCQMQTAAVPTSSTPLEN